MSQIQINKQTGFILVPCTISSMSFSGPKSLGAVFFKENFLHYLEMFKTNKNSPKSCVLSSNLVVLSSGDQDLGRDASNGNIPLIVSNNSASRHLSGGSDSSSSRLVNMLSRLDVERDLQIVL